MKISFEQTGGFAGLLFTITIDTAELTPDEAEKLVRMVDDAGFFSLPARIAFPRPQPDRFQYQLTVEESGRRHTVTINEEAMPTTLSPLVKWLAEAARRKLLEKRS